MSDEHVCTIKGWTEADIERHISRIVAERDVLADRANRAEAERDEWREESADRFTDGFKLQERASAAEAALRPLRRFAEKVADLDVNLDERRHITLSQLVTEAQAALAGSVPVPDIKEQGHG